MRFQQIFLIFGFLMMVGCKNFSETPIAKPQEFDTKKYADSLKSTQPVLEKNDSILISTDSMSNSETHNFTIDTIKLMIQNGQVVMDTIKKPRQKLVFVFDSDTANRLSVKISSPDSLANLRINQIIDAKENADGPFGKELDYKIQEKGLHHVIVSENQMAGNPWGGRLKFELKLSW